MKSIKDIIREQLEEEAFIRLHEAEILEYCAGGAGLAGRKRPSAVTLGREATLIMNETGTSG